MKKQFTMTLADCGVGLQVVSGDTEFCKLIRDPALRSKVYQALIEAYLGKY